MELIVPARRHLHEVRSKEFPLGNIYRKYGVKSSCWAVFIGSTKLIVPAGRHLQEVQSKEFPLGGIYRKYRVDSTRWVKFTGSTE